MTKKNSILKTTWMHSLFLVAILILLQVISSKRYWRIDLTQEKRYSLASVTQQFLKELDDRVYIKIYLAGNLPSGLKQLQQSTEDMLNECKAYAGSNIEWEFIDIYAYDAEMLEAVSKELIEKGLRPTSLTVVESGEQTQKVIFAGAILSYKGRDYSVQLLEDQFGGLDQYQAINQSIVLLEYKLANAVKKLTLQRNPTIAFSSGHGELEKLQIADFIQTLQLNAFDVSKIDVSKGYKIDPDKVDVLVFAKPANAFTEKEKFKIDQYIMQGGRVLWLLDNMIAEMDSLNQQGMYLSLPRALNLKDLLFKYGVRVNDDLIRVADRNEMLPVGLVTGYVGETPQIQHFPWPYYPLAFSTEEHAIVKNINPVSFQFVSTIDTVRVKDITKTILLETGQYSKALFPPVRVQLDVVNQPVNPETYTQPNLPVAVLLEGTFTSLYKNRLPESYLQLVDSVPELSFFEKSVFTKQVVISDGDIIRNDVSPSGNPYPLGFDRYSGRVFSNNIFLMNIVEYLANDNNLIETRNKEIKLRQLDAVKVNSEKTKWQTINVFGPVLFFLLFGSMYNWLRKRKYERQ